jgi:hypothetical protein
VTASLGERQRVDGERVIEIVAKHSPGRGGRDDSCWAQAEVRRRGSWRSPSRECTRLIDRRQRMLSALVASVRGRIRDAWL